MKKAEFDLVLKGIVEKLLATREQGQKEYAHGEVDDVFNNFKRVASDLGISMETALLVYMKKHMDGIHAWVKGHRSQRENVRGRIIDLMVYSALLYGMVEEIEPNGNGNVH